MKDLTFSVTEKFASPASPDRETFRCAVALWLTRELSRARG